MISLSNISLMRGSKMLIEDSSLTLHSGERIGIIGRNGSGKTSLFAAFSGDLGLEQGSIAMPEDLRLSMMKQETEGSERTALDHVIDADKAYRHLQQQLRSAEAEHDDNAMARIHSELDRIGAYDIENRAEQLLSGLGFTVEQFEDPVASFSGGWRVRLNLVAALMCPSDLLMLDEPTNHLDLEATLWLEQWLLRYSGTILVISHDRSFLDKIINRVISFESLSLVSYKGNYSDYERLRAERMALEQAMYEKQQRRRSEIEDFVRRFRAKATKARQAQSRLKELNRMQDIAPAHIDSPFRFQFPELERVPDFLLSLDRISIGYDSALADNIRLTIRGTSRIGLLGFNGQGKSTLLKVLANKLMPLSGSLEPSKHLKIGYFAQHQVDELDLETTPLQTIQRLGSKVSEQEIRNYLGGFDFRGSRADEQVRVFSGGEKARLALAKVTWQQPNLLLMDEPTNHLDLEMRHALTVALQAYQGAMIVVSHDRHLLSNTVEEFFTIHQGQFAEFDGDLDDYQKWMQNERRSSKPQASAVTAAAKIDKKELRQQAANLREQQAPLRKEANRLEKTMAALGREGDEIEEKLGQPSIYDDANKSELRKLLQQQGEQKKALQDVEDRWMEIQEILEA